MAGLFSGSPKHEAPEPLEGPVVGTITGGTILWFVLFLVQLPFYGWFADRGQTWWVWTCLAGAGLGCIGIWYVRGRDAALKRHAAEREAADQEAAERDATERAAAERDAAERADAGRAAAEPEPAEPAAAEAAAAEPTP